MKLKPAIISLKSLPDLPKEGEIRRKWAWSWTWGAFIGTVFMTGLTAFLEIWGFLWFGITLIISYLIYIPILRSTRSLAQVNGVFCAVIIMVAAGAMISMGGLLTSFGLIFVGLNCSMASAISNDMRWVKTLFGLYFISIAFIALLQPYLTVPAYVTPERNLLFFTLNSIWVVMSAFVFVQLMISDQARFEKLELKRVRDLEKVREKLYTNFSHELKTPVSIIQSQAEMIQENPKRWLTKGVKNIVQQCSVLTQLISQVLLIAKTKANFGKRRLVYGNVKDFICSIIEQFEPLAMRQRVSLSLQSGEGNYKMEYEPDLLYHLITNGLSNALKFTSTDNKVEVQISQKDDKLEITIKDNGQGVSPENIKHIFDRYYEANPQDHLYDKGFGIGLHLCKELVELQNGSICLKNNEEGGSSLFIKLPIHQERTSEAYSVTKMPEEGSEVDDHGLMKGAGKLSIKPKILIVEDNRALAAHLKTILGDIYRVYLAYDGMEGLKKGIQMVPDIIITDIMMPKMDGLKMIAQLKSHPITDHIPIILLTALNNAKDRIEALEAWAEYYISKPFRKKELLLAIRNILHARELTKAKLASYNPDLPSTQTNLSPEVKFIASVRKIIEDNIEDESFDIRHLCAALAMSRSQFYRKFSSLTQLSIGTYIQEIRLIKAKQILETENTNVTEAAMQTGFKNLSHFSRAFKKRFGISPSEVVAKEFGTQDQELGT